MRWANTNLIMICFKDHCVAQIFVLLVISVIFQILLLGSKPFDDKCNQRMAVVIEASISIYLYSLLSLTNYSGENTPRIELGWVLAMITGIVIGINVILFLWKILCRAVMLIKLALQKLSLNEMRTVPIKPHDSASFSLHRSDNLNFIANN
jgi:hypothetical protein